MNRGHGIEDRLPLGWGKLLLLGLCLVFATAAVSRGLGGPQDVRESESAGSDASRDAPNPEIPSLAPSPTASRVTKASARVEGTPAPGLRITLSADESQGEDLQFFWVQTAGPPIELETPDSPRVTFLIPGEARELAFQLVAAGRQGIDRTTLTILLDLQAVPALPSILTSDAGDDQVAVVGRRVTLNGIRSKPRDRASYRWIQVAGPPASEVVEEGCIFSFVPTAAGEHRFVLVVAADQAISQPDEVVVSVLAAPPPSSRTSSAFEAAALEGFAREQAASVAESESVVEDLAAGFDEIQARMSLYQTYDEVLSELSRRLEAALPDDPTLRADWDRLVFEPLTGRMIEALRGVGLDLTRADACSRPLTSRQKAQIAEVFRGISRGFRSLGSPESAGRPDAVESGGDRQASVGSKGRG